MDPDIFLSSINERINTNDWKRNLSKLENLNEMEGVVESKGFVIVNGILGVTYGRTTVIPVLKGRIRKIEDQYWVDLVVRPRLTGMIILSCVYLIILCAFVSAIRKPDLKLLIFCCVFFGVTYFSVMHKFNKVVDKYWRFIEDKLR